MTLENNYEQHWHLLEQHQKRQLSSTVIAQVKNLDCYPKRLESYRANDISFLLIFSHEKLTSPGLVWTHTRSPGFGKVGNNLINRGCVVPCERFESYLSQHQYANEPGGPQGVQAEVKIILYQDYILISRGATWKIKVPACFSPS